jgi:hypothetical protein
MAMPPSGEVRMVLQTTFKPRTENDMTTDKKVARRKIRVSEAATGDFGIKLTRDQTNSLAFNVRFSRFSPHLCQSRGRNRTSERPSQPHIAPVVGFKHH